MQFALARRFARSTSDNRKGLEEEEEEEKTEEEGKERRLAMTDPRARSFSKGFSRCIVELIKIVSNILPIGRVPALLSVPAIHTTA